MPSSHSLRFIAVAVVLSFAAGCAVETSSDRVASQADELSAGLRGITILKGSVTEGGTVTVAYEPSLYGSSGRPPFLAVELVTVNDAPAAAPSTLTDSVSPRNGTLSTPLSINVAGDFPGSPRVLVTDENFHVLAAQTGTPSWGGDEANLTVEGHGKRFILVRDMDWVAPMTFQVTAGR